MSNSSSGSNSESSDEEGWQDANPADDEEAQVVISLLDDRTFPDALSMLAYCKSEHQFDLLAVRDRLGLDFYGTVKLINFIRQRVHEGLPVPKEITVADIDREEYLKPVLDDDALIFELDSLPAPSTPAQAEGAKAVDTTTADGTTSAGSDAALAQKNRELQLELERLTSRFESYRLAVQQTLDLRWGVNGDAEESAAAAATAATGATASTTASSKEAAAATSNGKDYYFESYAYNDIHETMLKDAVRTDAYRDFIYGHKHLFAGKTVLDIGCGTGILSMFCAKAGAKMVIAVDRSDIADKARENIFHNGMSDKITVLKGLVEEVKLPVKQVDIIVSEWMGYALLYEAMLPSVLWARDKYLKPDGLLVPSHASIWLAPVADSEYIFDTITFWQDVYGFDMKAMQDGIYEDSRVVVMPEKGISGTPCMFRYLDLHTVKPEELVFKTKWKSVLADSAESLDGFLVWFDIYFGTSYTESIEPPTLTAKEWQAGGKDRVSFTTGPFGKETHWRQCLLVNKSHSRPLHAKQSRDLSGSIAFVTATDNPRALTLEMDWSFAGGNAEKQSWALK